MIPGYPTVPPTGEMVFYPFQGLTHLGGAEGVLEK